MKNRKKSTKLVLLVLLVCITLGYAALRTGLNINGTANVASSSWNVHFENYQMSNATNITPTTEPEIIGTTTTSISYEVDLDEPGDLYEFSVEVVNGGSLDANISLVYKYNGSEISQSNPVPAYIDYVVSDENGDPIVDNHRLNHGEREIVKVYIKYKDNDASVLPSQDMPGLSFDIEINAEQARGPAPQPVENFTVPYDSRENGIHLNQSVPNNIPILHSTTDAMNAWMDLTIRRQPKPYFFKHTLSSSNIVRENYMAIVITEEDHQSDSNLIPGVYYLKGGDGGEAYNTNKTTLLNAFSNCKNYPDCSCGGDETSSHCSTNYGLLPDIDVFATGQIRAYEYDGSEYSYCYIETNGDAYCGHN